MVDLIFSQYRRQDSNLHERCSSRFKRDVDTNFTTAAYGKEAFRNLLHFSKLNDC